MVSQPPEFTLDPEPADSDREDGIRKRRERQKRARQRDARVRRLKEKGVSTNHLLRLELLLPVVSPAVTVYEKYHRGMFFMYTTTADTGKVTGVTWMDPAGAREFAAEIIATADAVDARVKAERAAEPGEPR